MLCGSPHGVVAPMPSVLPQLLPGARRVVGALYEFISLPGAIICVGRGGAGYTWPHSSQTRPALEQMMAAKASSSRRRSTACRRGDELTAFLAAGSPFKYLIMKSIRR